MKQAARPLHTADLGRLTTQLLPLVGGRRSLLLAAALTLLLHLLVSGCITGWQLVVERMVVPPALAAGAAYSSARTHLARLRPAWAVVALVSQRDLTVAGSAVVSRSLAARGLATTHAHAQPPRPPDPGLCPAAPWPEQQGEVAQRRHREDSSGNGASSSGASSSSASGCDQELARCSCLAHRCTQWLESAQAESGDLRQQLKACTEALLNSRARAAAALGLRLWAAASTSACIVLGLQLLGRHAPDSSQGSGAYSGARGGGSSAASGGDSPGTAGLASATAHPPALQVGAGCVDEAARVADTATPPPSMGSSRKSLRHPSLRAPSSRALARSGSTPHLG